MSVLSDTASEAGSEENYLLPNESATATAVTATTDNAALIPSPPPLPRPHRRLPDPIHTTIEIPIELDPSQAVNPHTIPASSPHPFSSRPAPVSLDPSPAMVIEEAAASSFVHSCCRVQEALAVVSALGDSMVYTWTGLRPEQATAAATMAIATNTLRTDIGIEEIEGIPIEAVAVQTLLWCTQLQVAMAGAVVGLLLEARAQAVSDGQLSPLSALPEVTEEIQQFSEETPLILQVPRKTWMRAEAILLTHDTITAFTGQPAATPSTITGFQQTQKKLSQALCHLQEKLADTRASPIDNPLRMYLESTASRLPDLQAEMLSFSPKDATSATAIHDMQIMLKPATEELDNAAYSLRYCVSVFDRLLSWRHSRDWRFKHLIDALCGDDSQNDGIRPMLEKTIPACDQAVLAIEATKKISLYTLQ